MKEKIKYLIDIHKSIFQDCKSKAQILYNNWDEHFLGGLLLGAVAAFLLNFFYGEMIVVQKIVLSAYNVSKVKLFYKILNLNLNLKPVKTMTIPSKMTKKQNRSKRILS